LKVNTLIEFIDAAADTNYVEGPFNERGGIMLVSFPGQFKTTIIRSAMESHNSALEVSDMNVQQWLRLREDFVTGRYKTLAFTDYEKVYQRHQSTAMHIEGIVKALVAEGYGTGPSGDQRMPTALSRALVIGAMTNDCLEARYDAWQKNGFLRRFLWLFVHVGNIEVINEAITKWKKIDFGHIHKVSIKPGSLTIPMSIDDKIQRKLELMMREQPGYNGPGYILLKKIAAVLIWRHSINGQSNRVLDIMEEITPALRKRGGEIVL
jgi:hypothetical protein